MVASGACTLPQCLCGKPERLRMKTSHSGIGASDMSITPCAASRAPLVHPELDVRQALPAEGVVAGTVLRQMAKTLQGLLGRRRMPGGNPPHDEVRRRHRCEPVALLLVDALVHRVPDEVLELLGRLPHAHVDEKVRVGADENIGGIVAGIVLEAPDE